MLFIFENLSGVGRMFSNFLWSPFFKVFSFFWWNNDLVGKVLDNQSRGFLFKTTRLFHG